MTTKDDRECSEQEAIENQRMSKVKRSLQAQADVQNYVNGNLDIDEFLQRTLVRYGLVK